MVIFYVCGNVRSMIVTMVTAQEGMNALHITCNKGMTEMVTLLLDTANHQKQFCYGKKKTAAGKPRPEKTCDCEDIINAKMRLQVNSYVVGCLSMEMLR